MNQELSNFRHGVHIQKGLINKTEIELLKKAFFENLKFCRDIRLKTNVEEEMVNTIHHVLFMNKIYQDVIQKETNINIIDKFFSGKKFILNSLGGQNNTKFNYASNIHRDTRFYTNEPLMLNTIWCLSPININTGATEFLLGSHLNEYLPDESEFECNKTILNAEPGDVVYFDSRIWHKAGKPVKGVEERIIFTPIYSRPFIKPGFDYSSELNKMGVDNVSTTIKQLCSYYSGVPKNHYEWYDWKTRKFYHKEQDL